MIKTTTLIQLSCLPVPPPPPSSSTRWYYAIIAFHVDIWWTENMWLDRAKISYTYTQWWGGRLLLINFQHQLIFRFSEPIVLYTFSTLAHSLICKIYALPLAQCFLYNASWTKHSEVSRSLSPLALVIIIHLCTSYGIIGLLWKPRHAPLDNINENKFAIPCGRRIHCVSARRNVPDIPDNDTTWLYCVENLWIMQQNQGLDQQ